MVRRIGLGAGALALALGATVGAGVAGATPVPVTFSGALSCSVAGTYHFSPSPGLTNTGTGTVTVTVKAKLTGCSGPGSTNGPVTLTKGTLIASSPVTMSNSFPAVTSGGPIPDLTGTIAWKGTGGHIVASAVTLTLQTMSYDTGTDVVTLYAKPVLSGGSFAGQSASTSGVKADLPGLTLSAHAAKGVKSVAFGKANPATFAIGA